MPAEIVVADHKTIIRVVPSAGLLKWVPHAGTFQHSVVAAVMNQVAARHGGDHGDMLVNGIVVFRSAAGQFIFVINAIHVQGENKLSQMVLLPPQGREGERDKSPVAREKLPPIRLLTYRGFTLTDMAESVLLTIVNVHIVRANRASWHLLILVVALTISSSASAQLLLS